MSQNQTTGTSVADHIAVINGQLTTTTHNIAKVYGKRHDNVLAVVRARMADAGEWGVLNFKETPYTDPQNGQTYQVIQMTKKGFHFVVGKFTGAKAVQHQIAFADEFERMEQELLQQQAPRVAYSANPNDTLTKEEADTLRQMVEGTAKKLSANSKMQGKFIMQAWAKLKSHFKVGYRAIPRHELTEAISIITRHTVDWEVVDAAPPLQMALPEEFVDVAELLLSGQTNPQPLTAAQHTLIDQTAGRLVGEAYSLIRAHLERRVAFNTNAAQQNDTATTQAILNQATLGNCLAHQYHTEVKSAKMLLQMVRLRLDAVLGSISQPLSLSH